MFVLVVVVDDPVCADSRVERVIGPILPSATNPLESWNACIVWIDFLPNTPSTFKLGDGTITVFSTVWMFFLSCRVSIFVGKEMKAWVRRGNNIDNMMRDLR